MAVEFVSTLKSSMNETDETEYMGYYSFKMGAGAQNKKLRVVVLLDNNVAMPSNTFYNTFQGICRAFQDFEPDDELVVRTSTEFIDLFERKRFCEKIGCRPMPTPYFAPNISNSNSLEPHLRYVNSEWLDICHEFDASFVTVVVIVATGNDPSFSANHGAALAPDGELATELRKIGSRAALFTLKVGAFADDSALCKLTKFAGGHFLAVGETEWELRKAFFTTFKSARALLGLNSQVVIASSTGITKYSFGLVWGCETREVPVTAKACLPVGSATLTYTDLSGKAVALSKFVPALPLKRGTEPEWDEEVANKVFTVDLRFKVMQAIAVRTSGGSGYEVPTVVSLLETVSAYNVVLCSRFAGLLQQLKEMPLKRNFNGAQLLQAIGNAPSYGVDLLAGNDYEEAAKRARTA